MSVSNPSKEPIRIGIDIGGTFTDVLLLDSTGKRWHVKVRSTPHDSSQGVINGLHKVLDLAHIQPEKVRYLLHGTTVATNTVLQRKGAKIGLITTKGFEDILHIGRQQRTSLYDLFVKPVAPLIPRKHIVGVEERILADGTVHLPLTEKQAKKATQRLSQNVEAIAICLLFAYQNPKHEKELLTQFRKHHPQLPVTISSSILPEYREYERMSTTVLNAYVAPVLAKYLQHLDSALISMGLQTPMLIMQSHGGVLQSQLAREQAVRLLFSGLAGGSLGGRYTSQIMNLPNVITFDMGGTSTDVSLITNGQVRETSEGHIDGLPCRVPMVDVETVGAGGGSIAWIDEGNILRVGPHSAGANPGPAAYGSGGQDPTVTDANLLLGRLNPEYFLGGDIPLHSKLAKSAIKQLSRQLSLSTEECAFGIIRVVNANMERAIRIVSIQRGYDPRDFALVAFGGAGPMHGWALAKSLGIPRVIVPLAPGLHSALGLLTTNLRSDQSQTVLVSTESLNIKQLQDTYKKLENQLRKLLDTQGVPKQSIMISRLADLRYRGQAYEITIQGSGGRISKRWLNTLVADFHRQHKQQYGYATTSAPVTIVNLRVVASGPMPSLKPAEAFQKQSKLPEPKMQRKVYYEEVGKFIETPIFERTSLGLGSKVNGPAIIEQVDSTTIVHPDTRAVVRLGGNLVLEAIT
ncbi:MAG: hydantoinase/oxoprolinase family protein [Promethearchaeota archaeon]